MIISLIIARGGSKGIPMKNLCHLDGKPLISYPIRAAINCKMIERAILVSDNENILSVGREYGTETPFKEPSYLADGTTPDLPVFTYALNWLRDNQNCKPDIIVHLRATCPLVTKYHIEEAINILMKHPSADSVRSVNVSEHTPYKMWKDDGEYIIPFVTCKEESFNMPRQTLPTVYRHNGYVDVIRYDTIMKKKSMCGDKVVPYVMPTKTYMPDIDEPIDLDIANLYMEYLKKCQ